MTDYWRLSNGGATVTAGCHRFGSGARRMTVPAWLRFFGSETLVIHIILSLRARSRFRTSCPMSKLSSSILDDKVDSSRSSHWSLLISRSLWSSFCFIRTIAHTFAISNIILKGLVRCSNIGLAMKIGCLLQCTCKCSPKVFFLILLWIVIPHRAGRRFLLWWSEVGNVEGSV